MRPAASRTPAPDCHVECLAMKLVGEKLWARGGGGRGTFIVHTN
jgi:hypothetical protein